MSIPRRMKTHGAWATEQPVSAMMATSPDG